MDHKPIWFITINLNDQVHCMGGLGFTKQFYMYVCAGNQEEACRLADTWATSQGCNVQNTSGSESTNQDVFSYTFPHQIINLSQSILDQIYDKRGYPPLYRNPARIVTLHDSVQ